MGIKMNRIFLALTALACLAASGCSTSGQTPQSEEVKNNRKKIDNFIKAYIQPEYEIPAVFAPEWNNNPDQKEIAALTKMTYTSLPFYTQAQKLKAISLIYATSDVKKSFIINASTEKNKISLVCRDEDKVQDIFKAEAEMPEMLVMPKGLAANMEDAVVREMYMIHSFIFAPRKLAKTVSMDVVPMLNINKNSTNYERKEYNIDNRLCYKLELQLRDMFGGGMIRLYVDGQDIVRIEIPSMILDVNASSAFALTVDAYQSVDGIKVPASFVFRGERFLLKENKIER